MARSIRRFVAAAVIALSLAPAPAASAAPAEAVTKSGASILATCSPGVFTQVHWYVNPMWPLSYRYQVNAGVFVQWRWYSGGVPPYWENSFTTTGDIWTPPSFYTSVEFMCSSFTNVTITPL